MLYYHYVQFVSERAGIESDDDAKKTITAVFKVLAQRIPTGKAAELAETLPAEIREDLKRDSWAALGVNEFIARIADKVGVDKPTAATRIRAVLSVLAEYLPSAELLDALHSVPKDMRRLFVWQS